LVRRRCARWLSRSRPLVRPARPNFKGAAEPICVRRLCPPAVSPSAALEARRRSPPPPAAAVIEEDACWDPSVVYLLDGCQENGGGLGNGGGAPDGGPVDGGGGPVDAGGSAPADAGHAVSRREPWPEPYAGPPLEASIPSPPPSDPPPAEVEKRQKECASVLDSEIEVRKILRSIDSDNIADLRDAILDLASSPPEHLAGLEEDLGELELPVPEKVITAGPVLGVPNEVKAVGMKPALGHLGQSPGDGQAGVVRTESRLTLVRYAIGVIIGPSLPCTAEKPSPELACPIQILLDEQKVAKVNFLPSTATATKLAPIVNTVSGEHLDRASEGRPHDRDPVRRRPEAPPAQKQRPSPVETCIHHDMRGECRSRRRPRRAGTQGALRRRGGRAGSRPG
jgi:hypothetical protein